MIITQGKQLWGVAASPDGLLLAAVGSVSVMMAPLSSTWASGTTQASYWSTETMCPRLPSVRTAR